MKDKWTLKRLHDELINLLDEKSFTKAFYATGCFPPIEKSNISFVNRIAIPFKGCHQMVLCDQDKLYQIRPKRGMASYFPVGSWNIPDWQCDVNVATFFLDSSFIQVNIVDLKRGEQLDFARNVTSLYTDYPINNNGFKIMAMLEQYQQNPHCHQITLLVELLIYYLAESLKPIPPNKMGKSRLSWLTVCNYLENHFSRELTRDYVAEVFKMSPNYLSNLFKEQSGISFSQYLTEIRLKHARDLLSKFTITLDEISLKCGYRDTSYFCRVFKKNNQMTPGQWRIKVQR